MSGDPSGFFKKLILKLYASLDSSKRLSLGCRGMVEYQKRNVYEDNNEEDLFDHFEDSCGKGK